MDSNLSERSGIDGDAVGTVIPSLVFLCRTVVTNNLERYTPESFYICDVYEWEEIIQLRHSTTQPNKKRALGSHLGTNDLDGNGRLLPAISDKVLQQIEECNEHIADSAIADTLVWKDCVEYRFKRNVGLLRPPILFVPWPILVQHIQNQCQTLSSIIIDSAGDGKEVVSKLTVDAISEAIHVLQSTTWNVALLRDTGIGKIVKRLLKKLPGNKTGRSCISDNHLIILQKLLSGWMNLATTNNITGTYQWKESSSSTKKVASTTMSSTLDSEEEAIQSSDLQLLEKCLSWRQLYQVLERRKGVIQATQGKRMRDIRNQVPTVVLTMWHISPLPRVLHFSFRTSLNCTFHFDDVPYLDFDYPGGNESSKVGEGQTDQKSRRKQSESVCWFRFKF